jgi:hypothetical protein
MTDLTPPERQHSTAVDEAARWLANTPDGRRPHPIIPHLQRQFGISAGEAVQAIRQSNLIRARAA